METPAAGTTGFTLTEVAQRGQVQVGGVAYEAETSATAIPAGEPIRVTGWRADNRHGVVLFIRRPGDDPPVAPDRADEARSGGREPTRPPPPLAPEERFGALERQLQGALQALNRSRPAEPPPFWSIAGLFRGIAVAILVVVPLAEFFYPPWLLYQELGLTGKPFTDPSKAQSLGVSHYHPDYQAAQSQPPAKAYSVLAKLGHYSPGSFGDGKLSGSDRPSIYYTKPGGKIELAKVDADLFVGIDWERLVSECLVALAVAVGLWRLGGSRAAVG